MWRCSGAHWLRVAALWAGFAALLIFLPDGHAEGLVRVGADAGRPVTSDAKPVHAKLDRASPAVRVELKPFTAAHLSERFGDEEEDEEPLAVVH